jgi:hypothetical protein
MIRKFLFSLIALSAVFTISGCDISGSVGDDNVDLTVTVDPDSQKFGTAVWDTSRWAE